MASCGPDYVPKPRAFYRVQFPEKAYQSFDTTCPYAFEYPVYAVINPDMKGDADVCWYNVEYLPFNAKLHLSYKPIVQEDDLSHLIEDAYTFVQKHNIKAEGIGEQRIQSATNAYGIKYYIAGNTASSIQFFLTDSTQHFLRASLYFMAEPNKDSLAPIVQFIEEDINYMIQSFRWKDVDLENYR